MKKWIVLLVFAVAVWVPVMPVECEEETVSVIETDMSGDEAEDRVLPEPEYIPAPNPIQVDVEDTWIPEEYQRYCREIGKRYNLCPELLMAMIEQESSGKPEVVSQGGDTGLLQVNAKWHGDRMRKLGVVDLTDAYANILVAADYLAQLYAENGDDLYLVLMKYNMKHSRAEELFAAGIYSDYAVDIAERSWELEVIHEKEESHD